MTDAAALVRTNLLDVFNERDAGAREAAIARIYAPGVVFTSGADEPVHGTSDLNAAAQRILDQVPADFVFTAGPTHSAGELGYQAWTLGPADGAAAVNGFDIAIVEDDRIARLYTILLPEN